LEKKSLSLIRDLGKERKYVNLQGNITLGSSNRILIVWIEQKWHS